MYIEATLGMMDVVDEDRDLRDSRFNEHPQHAVVQTPEPLLSQYNAKRLVRPQEGVGLQLTA